MGEKEGKKFAVVDLFAGAGGMSEGFSQAGFKIIAANEILEDAAETFKLNHPEAKMIIGNIEKISPESFLNECGLKKEDIDLVIGGPPCQGFSMANRQRLINDSRNHLYKYFVNFVDNIRPKVFIMENVKGILHKSEDIVNDFKKIGYTLDFRLLNAKNYGIPQNRERVFFVGIKNVLGAEAIVDNIFNLIEKRKVAIEIPLKDALWGLRKIKARSKKNKTDLEVEDSGFSEDNIVLENESPPKYILQINNGKVPTKVYNHKSRFNNERDLEIFKRLPQGGKSDHPSIADIMPYKKRSHIFKDKYYKLMEYKVSKTITSHMKFDCNMYIHPRECRGLTPREAARIQSFPDSFKFTGSFTKWYLQIGNAVPPLLAKEIAESVKEALKGVKNEV